MLRLTPSVIRWRHIRGVVFVAAVGVVDLIVWGGESTRGGSAGLPPWTIPALTAVMCGLLLLRDRHPLPVFAVQWAFPLINLAVPDYQPFVLLLVALYAVAALCPAYSARPALLAVGAPFGLYCYRYAELARGANYLRDLLWAGAIYAVLAGVAWGLGRVMHARQAQARAELARQADEAERMLEAERLRLAHELHDSVSGTVVGMILQAAGAKTVYAGDDQRVRDTFELIEKAGQQAMNELHRMLGLLRTADLPSASEQPRFGDLDELVGRTRSAGLDVTVEVTGDSVPLDPSVDLAAYRIVQESLTNVAKHAGERASVRVDVRWRADDLVLEVRSSGGTGPPSGSAALSSGHGLRGLRERVHLVGGCLDAGPVADGWAVRAELPVVSQGRGPQQV